ncbi:hypothetical protein DBR32_06930 [Taibaiella sp. KBW10]|uniref:hypothetical protein n=1 Tax=Taibaiella sp. KBW10 TaxID=2153357 RepID=UPI000F59BAC2|nr:hypothetical protein [Taibaiella sp. KBW10]RQO31675.1 hypothetical protein DBR32_06930 [Taibaiella sp. KBW10]
MIGWIEMIEKGYMILNRFACGQNKVTTNPCAKNLRVAQILLNKASFKPGRFHFSIKTASKVQT